MDNIRIISALVSCRTRHTADTEYLRAFALITLTFAPGSAPPVLKCRSLFSTAGFPYGVSAVLPAPGYGCPFRGKSRSFPPALLILYIKISKRLAIFRTSYYDKIETENSVATVQAGLRRQRRL